MLRFLLFIIACTYSIQVIPYTLDESQIREINTHLVSQMINSVRPSLSKQKKSKIAKHLSSIANEYKIDPRIVVAIIDAESEFDQTKVSKTGDVSIAQINPKVWSKEFERIGHDKLDAKKLRKSEAYALEKMVQILSNLKHRFEKRDKMWYARYHSSTKVYKNLYFLKLKKRMTKIAKVKSTPMILTMR